MTGRPEVIALLMERRANPEPRLADGLASPALHIACALRFLGCVVALAARKADVNAANRAGQRLLTGLFLIPSWNGFSNFFILDKNVCLNLNSFQHSVCF